MKNRKREDKLKIHIKTGSVFLGIESAFGGINKIGMVFQKSRKGRNIYRE